MRGGDLAGREYPHLGVDDMDEIQQYTKDNQVFDSAKHSPGQTVEPPQRHLVGDVVDEPHQLQADEIDQQEEQRVGGYAAHARRQVEHLLQQRGERSAEQPRNQHARNKAPLRTQLAEYPLDESVQGPYEDNQYYDKIDNGGGGLTGSDSGAHFLV